MQPAEYRSLDAEELQRLDRFLHSPACGPDAMDLAHAHGFLAALAAGPESLASEEWLRLIFDEPVFADGEQAQDMLGLAMRMYQQILGDLGEQGRFRPILDTGGGESSKAQSDASHWCMGFISGMSLCREQWSRHAGGLLGEPLSVIFMLSRTPASRGDDYAQWCDILPVSVEVIYRYWRANGAEEPATQ